MFSPRGEKGKMGLKSFWWEDVVKLV